MANLASRGSEWGKWDLHLHTPASPDYKDKSLTDIQIVEKLAGLDIKVAVITDHNTVDVNRIKSLQTEAIKKSILILPGIELRGEHGKEPINYIGIFPENCDLAFLQSELYSKLDLSKKRKDGKSEDELYCPLEKGTKLIHELGGIVSVHAGKKSNSIECIPNTLPSSMAQKDEIASWVDLFELGSKDDETDYESVVFRKIGRRYPMIVASDNHDIKQYTFKKNEFCWIKSFPSFEGLKQVIYEPTDRIKIQELCPEEKSPQSIIDHVEYTGLSGDLRKVYFNKNLNSLIGSRAQGKSNLLRNMAYSIDPVQCGVRGISKSDFLPLKDFKLIWADGKANTLDDSHEEKEKGVLFIPQRYLGELVYDKNRQFDSFLIGLFENNASFKNGQDTYKKFEDNNALEIASLLQVVLETQSQGLDRAEKIKKLGTKDGFDKEIKEIEGRIKKYGQTAQISDAELKSYDSLSTYIKKTENRAKVIFRDIESLNRLQEQDVITTGSVDEYEFSDVTYHKIAKELSKTDKEFKTTFIKTEVKTLIEESKTLETETKNLAIKLKPLEEKIKKSTALVTLTKILDEKKTARVNIELLEKEKDELLKRYNVNFRNLLDRYLSYETQYKSLELDIDDKLEYSNVRMVVSFNEDSFRRFIDENINYHNSIDFKKTESKAKMLWDDPVSWHYDQSIFKEILKDILSGILSGKLILKMGKNKQSVLSELLSNRFKIDFLKSVTKDRVTFTDMSDGEQMLALLEFIFKFDDYNYPVLLDQPEDDLDAKAISSTIVEFIKSEKTTRQIIVASHNANLVVCGDSENIIVSNKIGGDNPDFDYLSGAIEEDELNKEILAILEGGKKAFATRSGKLGIK